MYCSECGAKARGKFCSSCGTRLESGGAANGGTGGLEHCPADETGDWTQTIDYAALLRYREVRERIEAAAAEAQAGVTGEQFMEFCEEALKPLTIVPIPYNAIAKIAQPMAAKWGLKTEKARTRLFSSPPGVVVVGVLCSLARRGHKLKQARQMDGACVLDAELTSDMFALTGELRITVRRDRDGGTWVEAATHIPGQAFDWGKSNRRLEQLMDDVAAA